MKGFEEQLRKQEAKIQGILDSTVTDRKFMEEKFEAQNTELRSLVESRNNETRSLITALTSQFNNFL